jgi:hypothetical protein
MRIKRLLIVVHRWLGVALCGVFLLWFPSAIVMMYRSYPEVTAADQLAHAPVLDAGAIRLSPSDAWRSLGETGSPRAVDVSTFDGRPVYRFRAGGGERIVYADTGDEQVEVSDALMLRSAALWTGQPASDARVDPVPTIDQWTLQVFRQGPLRKYTWPNGDQVYVSENTGEVVQATTRADRVWAYLGAIPHWLYFTPLRRDGPLWNRVVIWTSSAATVAAVLGLIIGVWMYSPRKRYRHLDAPTRIPYRGQKRWHTILGLLFGAGAVTWAFSGLLSMQPFAPAAGGASGPRAPNPATLLRQRAPLEAFADRSVRDALVVLDDSAKELELTAVDGEPVYLATLADGATRIVPVHGPVRVEFDRARLMERIRRAAGQTPIAELRLVTQYDRYYLDRRREAPLPVILARFEDTRHTRYYIDPKTATVVGGYQDSGWIDRWLYHGLHSLNFPWLYNNRPLWDIVVLTFMIGGTALCVTSLVMAWQVLGRKLRARPPTAAV